MTIQEQLGEVRAMIHGIMEALDKIVLDDTALYEKAVPRFTDGHSVIEAPLKMREREFRVPRLADAPVCDRSRPAHLFVIMDEEGNILCDDC